MVKVGKKVRQFWVSTTERAAKTFFQTLGVTLGAGYTVLHFDWKASLAMAGVAALASVCTSIGSAPIGPDGSPSLVGEPPQEPQAVIQGETSK